ncbi:MAG TPA: glutamate synthase-related protein [Candidatus Hydrogenedentes bacterium]|nr:glutamate synthase-related protein [Candidatus Hydrogenedentota bacterium]
MNTAATMRWVCTVCGYVHEGPEPPEECPVCGAGPDLFEAEAEPGTTDSASPGTPAPEEYLAAWARDTDGFETKFARIKALASGAPSEISPMRTQQPFPSWESVLFRGAQLARLPRNEDEPVNTRTVLGRSAAKPLAIAMPFYVSHMSFGALSREAKIALARGSRMAGTLICSGEGGLLPEERAEAALYIYELGTATFSHRDDAIRQADAVEIKIGQAAKPGLGGHLPAER